MPTLGFDTVGVSGTFAAPREDMFVYFYQTDGTGGTALTFHAACATAGNVILGLCETGAGPPKTASSQVVLDKVPFACGISDDENSPSVSSPVLLPNTFYGIVWQSPAVPRPALKFQTGVGPVDRSFKLVTVSFPDPPNTLEAGYTSEPNATLEISMWVDYEPAVSRGFPKSHATNASIQGLSKGGFVNA